MQQFVSLILIFFILFSCTEKKNEQTQEASTTSKCKDVLADSLFVFEKGVGSSQEVENYELNWSSYFDPKKSIPFKKLTVDEKLGLLQKILPMPPEWIKTDIGAFYIAKQPKIGCIQPIVVETFGTDFAALLLITVGENGNPVSGMFLNGGENSGPLEANDSVTVLRPIKKCFFNKNKIESYVLNITAISNHNLAEVPATVDSVRYISEIDSLGAITTKRIDSARYKRKYRW